MSTAVTLTARRNQNLYRQPVQVQFGSNSSTFVVIAFVLVLAFLYLSQITKTNAFSYKINQITVKNQTLINQNDDLSVEAGRLQSLQTTQNSAVAKAMVPVVQVSYIH